MQGFEKIKFEVQDHIALIDLNSPQTMNRLYAPFFRDLYKAADIIDNDETIFAAVLTGGEKVFCTGDDVTQPEELQRQKELGLFEWMKIVQDSMNRISHIKKPIIAAAAGYTLGGGLELALSCDFIVVSENVKMGQPEAKIGLLPCGGGTQRLPRLIGKPLSKELIFTGDFLDAKRALEIGLVNHVYPEGHLIENALALAGKICAKTSPASNQMIKHAIDGGCEANLENGLYLELSNAYRAGYSPDKEEGLKAFAEKRAPVWSGKMF